MEQSPPRHGRGGDYPSANLQKIPKRIREIKEAWDACCLKKFERARMQTFHLLLQEFADTMKSQGVITIAKRLDSIQAVVEHLISTKSDVRDFHQVQITEGLDEIEKSAQLMARMTDDVGFSTSGDLQIDYRPLYLLTLVKSEKSVLASQLMPFGYNLEVFTRLAPLRERLAKKLPQAILIDLVWQPDEKTMRALRKEVGHLKSFGVPIIYLVQQGKDMRPWLEAVYSGADACVPKPPNIHSLLNRIDYLSSLKQAPPYRILIIEDDDQIARSHRQILEAAGMDAQICQDPLSLMQNMVEFKPDLVLMDLHLSNCNGLVLGHAIRQYDAFISVPIVFCGDLERTQQLETLRLGGDDFLLKPINPRHLVMAIQSRVRRARELRDQMDRDDLTGLHFRTSLHDLFEIELSRARRAQTPLVFGILDVDRLQVVNEKYGYSCGDLVLLSLAQQLKTRLRRTDCIGRYAGEQFAVILHKAEERNGFKVINDLRRDFSRIDHQFQATKFHVTFSAGLACFPHYEDMVGLMRSAEDALREAKQNGRNQVFVSN